MPFSFQTTFFDLLERLKFSFWDKANCYTIFFGFCSLRGPLLPVSTKKRSTKNCEVIFSVFHPISEWLTFFSSPELETKVIVMRSTTKKEMKSSNAIGSAGANTAAKMTDGSVLCPKCNHKELFFKTAQLRSADEGQTIFYECCKCSYTWSFHS